MFLSWLWNKLQDETGQVFNPFARPGSGGLINLEDIFGRDIRQTEAQRTGDLRTQGLQTLRAATDPTQQINIERQRFESAILPQILARLSAAGVGRGGAAGEAVSRGFSSLIAPILARTAQAQQNLGQGLINVGQNVAGERAQSIRDLLGLRTNQAQINAGINAQNLAFSQASRNRIGTLGTPFGSFGFGGVNLPNLGFRGGGTNTTTVAPRTPLTDEQVKAQQQAASALAQSRLAEFPTGASFFAPTGTNRFLASGGV